MCATARSSASMRLARSMAAEVIRGGRAALGPEKFLCAGFRLFNGEVGGADGLTARVNACVEAGAEGLNFYNYGLIPAKRLDWIRAAVGSV